MGCDSLFGTGLVRVALRKSTRKKIFSSSPILLFRSLPPTTQKYRRSTRSTTTARSIMTMKKKTSPSRCESLGTGTMASDSENGSRGVASLEEDFDNLVSVNDALDDQHAGQHPALQSMCVIDCNKQVRIVPNGEPAILDNDCFEGKVMLLVRTPDVDDSRDSTLLAETPQRISQYFGDKKRQWEFQFQLKLKKVPTGPLFLGCELEHGIKVGAITKGLVGILLAMVRRINPGFHYSWGPVHKQKLDGGNYEKTHLSFPVEASMDRIVITKPGETPPVLGYELIESPESVRRRRKMGAGSVDWNLDDTYTMCLWSMYVNWLTWRSSNVPGVSPFSLSRVTGKQPIYLCVYEITKCSPQEYRKKRPAHLRRDMVSYARMEFSNSKTTEGGYAEALLGRKRAKVGLTDHSIPDTDSIDSDFEVASRVTT